MTDHQKWVHKSRWGVIRGYSEPAEQGPPSWIAFLLCVLAAGLIIKATDSLKGTNHVLLWAGVACFVAALVVQVRYEWRKGRDERNGFPDPDGQDDHPAGHGQAFYSNRR